MEFVKDDDDDDVFEGRLSALMPRSARPAAAGTEACSNLDPHTRMDVHRQLFSEPDAAVKKGILQVYVRMKPLKPGAVSCMHAPHGELLKATW
jgi:hypothetical protein